MTEVILSLFLGLAAWSDWQTRRIPNKLVFPFMLIGILYQFGNGEGVVGLGGLITAFFLTLFPVLFKGMGMGDQKLLMALGAWTSYTEVYQIAIGSLLSCVVVLICTPRSWRKLVRNMRVVLAGWHGHREVWLPDSAQSALSFPYAIHLFVAYVFLTVSESINFAVFSS